MKNMLIGTKNYFSESASELRRVTWPTKQQAVKLTLIVLAFFVLSAVVVGIFDLGFNQFFKFLLSLSK